MAFFWRRLRGKVPTSGEEYQKELEQLRKKAPVPCVWLFGKTGSGKSSVIRFLTGAEAAIIGVGYRPETKTSRRFDFPDSLEPLLTFLDTRGLGEASYDPKEDIEQFARMTQLMIVTIRVTDHALQGVIEPLRRIRRASPQRPVLLLLTCLHEATGSFDISKSAVPITAQPAIDSPQESNQPVSPAVPAILQLLIDEKLAQFSSLYDIVIPVDLTQPEDGFADPNFGGEQLKQAILDYLPHAYRQALLSLNRSDRSTESFRQKRVRWQVLSSSALAATAGAVPIPWVDIPSVLAIQAHLALRIAEFYGQEITPAQWAVLSSAVGSRIALGMAVREALKFIPLVGMAVGAASSFAFTYALGMSWDWYFSDLSTGNVPSAEKLKEIFAAQLKQGHQLWRAG